MNELMTWNKLEDEIYSLYVQEGKCPKQIKLTSSELINVIKTFGTPLKFYFKKLPGGGSGVEVHIRD